MREPIKERPVSLKSEVIWKLYDYLVKTNPPVIFLNKKDENGVWDEEVLYVRDIELINNDCFFGGFTIDDVQFGNSSSKTEGVRVFYTDKLTYLIRGMGYGGYTSIDITINALKNSRPMQELLEAKRLRLPTEEESEKYRQIIKEYFEENADILNKYERR
ncbi:MAG: hypothetical protein K5776_04190 [Lachnospiraceae bacterium]|nr:hypothetical protein [Lachnospiraceae bacterium]